MKRFILFLMALCTWVTVFCQQTVTVTANNEDISNGLDLKVVAKLFAESQNLKQFEALINNPDSMFCNLDINGDGDVDYLRVVSTGEGNSRLIVLQAVLAPDIYQDVASIYVEKEEKTNEVSVQIIGDEYVYGTNYIIEPVYIYRPLIYSYLWTTSWVAWTSPYYWGCYPHWWYVHRCWLYDRYWHRCYNFHRHHHHYCSFRHGHEPNHRYHDMHGRASHHEYADRHHGTSFKDRNAGSHNAHDIHRGGVEQRKPTNHGQSVRQPVNGQQVGSRSAASQRGGQQTTSRRPSQPQQRSGGNVNTQRSGSDYQRSGKGSVSSTTSRHPTSQPQISSTRSSGSVSRGGSSQGRGGNAPTRSSGSISSPSRGSGGSPSRGGGPSGGSRRR